MAQKMRPVFYDLHAVTLDPDTTPDQLAHALRRADAMPDRRRASEGAVYGSALRRYTMLTGTDWRTVQQTPDATTWGGQSDHRYRERLGDQGVTWFCSCGALGVEQDSDDAVVAHAAHVAAARVPA